MERHEFDARFIGFFIGSGTEREFFKESLKAGRFVFVFPFSGFADEFIEVFFPVLECFGIFLEMVEVVGGGDGFGDEFMEFE